MLNTRDLERRWLKWKIKSYIPHTVIVVSLVVISSIALFYLSSPKTQPQTPVVVTKEPIQTQQQQPKSEQKPQAKVTVQTKSQQPVKQLPTISSVVDTTLETHKEPKKIVLKPSMDFMKGMQEVSGDYYIDNTQANEPQQETVQQPFVANNTPAQSQPSGVATQNPEPEVIEEKQEVAITQQQPSEEATSKKVVITIQSSMQDIKDAERRFSKHNSPALSLFLARQYYNRGIYTKSYNYALITNQLDKEIEDSWLIFARSLVKLGKKEKAIKALKEYIKYSQSSNAKLLLNDIQNGKFQ